MRVAGSRASRRLSVVGVSRFASSGAFLIAAGRHIAPSPGCESRYTVYVYKNCGDGSSSRISACDRAPMRSNGRTPRNGHQVRLTMFSRAHPPRLGAVVNGMVIDLPLAHEAFRVATGDDCESPMLIEALVPSDSLEFLQGGHRSREAAEETLSWLSGMPDGARGRTSLWGQPLVHSLDIPCACDRGSCIPARSSASG